MKHRSFNPANDKKSKTTRKKGKQQFKKTTIEKEKKK
jgi:hypothetical protein